MKTRRSKRLLVTVLAVAGSLLLAALIANTAIRSRSVQNWVLKHLMQRLDVRLSMDIRRMTLDSGLGIGGRGFSAYLPDAKTRITAPRVTLGFDAGALLRGQLYLQRLVLYHPRIVISGTGSDRAATDWTGTPVLRRLSHLKLIHLQGGEVVFQDRPWKINDLVVDLTRSSENPPHFDLRLAATVDYQDQSAAFTLTGPVSGNEKNLGALAGSATLSAWKVPFSWIPANRYLSFDGGQANLEMKIDMTGDGAVSAGGRIWSTALDFRLTAGATGMNYRLETPGLDFRLNVADGVWQLSSFHLETRSFSLAGQSRIDMHALPAPHLAIKVRAPCMPLASLKSIIPYPVLPPWFKMELMPLFTRGQVCIDTFDLDGDLDRIRGLDRRENAHVIAMRLRLTEIEAFKGNIPIPLEKASGELAVCNGQLAVTGIRGKLATSTIEAASFHIADLYADKTTATAAVTGNFELTDLNKLVISPGNTLAPGAQERIRPLAGRARAQLGLHFENMRQLPEIKSADAQLNNSRIMIRGHHFDVNRASVRLNPGGLLKFTGNARWQKTSVFTFSGYDRLGEHQGRATLDAQADVARVVEQLIPNAPLEVRQPAINECRLFIDWGSAGATFTGKLDLDEIKVSWKKRAAAVFQANSRLEFSIGAPTGGGVVFQRMDLTAGPTSLVISGNYDPDRRPKFFFDVASDYFSPHDIGLDFTPPANFACGVFTGRLQVESAIDEVEHIRITGDLSGEGIRPKPSKETAPVTQIDFGASFSGRRIRLAPLKITTDGQVVLITGDLGSWQQPTGTLYIVADILDLEALSNLGEDKTGSLTTWFKSADLKIDIGAPVLRFKNFCAGPLTAQGRLRSGILTIDNASITHPRAMITGDGYLSLFDGPTAGMHLSAQVAITKYPLETLLRQTGLNTSRFTGSISLLGNFNTRGDNGRDLAANLNGAFNLWAEQGVIRKSSIILKIMDKLSIKDIFDRRPPEAAGDSFYYENIQNRSSIKQGTLSLEYFRMDSPAFNALATGSMTLATGVMAFDLGVQPLGTIDTLVSHVPVIGHILTGEDKSVLVYNFKVSGKASAPEITYVPFKNLGKNVLGYFKRMFLTPGRLWNKLSDFTRDYSRNQPPGSRWQWEKDPDHHHGIR